MAALQAIRSKGAFLIGVIGLALFAFIAEEFFRSFETTSNLDRQKVGEVYGKSLSVQDFQDEVEQRSEIVKIQRSMQGQGDAISDREQEQIRETVWQEYVQNTIIGHEAEKLGLQVTDEDEQNALRDGQSQSLQMLAQLGFANPQTGQFDVTALQDFLKNYDKSMQQMAQSGQQQYMEQYQQIRKIWEYTEKQLRKELLSMKYGVLLSQAFISNPISAKMDFDDQTVKYTADVVAIPYNTINDKEVSISESDMKAMYSQYKELFRNQGKSAAFKVLDVTVTATEADKKALTDEIKALEARLQGGEDAAAVVGSSKTVYAYSNLPMSKKAFSKMTDVAAKLDSVAVGSVVPTYYNAGDNTINTFKLIAKTQAPDSVQYRMIAAPAQTPEKSATLADSILKAVQGGAAFADIAKKYGQKGDSVWMTSDQYEGPGMSDEEAKMISEIMTMEPGMKIVSNSQGSIVVQVLNRKNMVTKYNVALVKCPLNFSKETYNAELGKLNKFLAENRTIASFEKNAAKAGYMLNDVPNYAQNNLALQANIGGSAAKDAMRWVFDEAEAGDISKVYECGTNNDHLLVIAVKGVSDDDYIGLDDENVKKTIKQLCLQQKKAELLAERTKGVKSLEDAKKQKGAVAETLTDVIFLGQAPSLKQVGTAEPRLAGAIARTAKGQFSGAVRGAGALYFVKTTNKVAGTEKFDAKAQQEMSAGRTSQMAMRGLIDALMLDADMKDNRYKF